MAAAQQADGQKGKARPDSSPKGFLRKLTPFVTNLLALDKWDAAQRALSAQAAAQEFARLSPAALEFIQEAIAQAKEDLENGGPELEQPAKPVKSAKPVKVKPAKLNQEIVDQLLTQDILGDHFVTACKAATLDEFDAAMEELSKWEETEARVHRYSHIEANRILGVKKARAATMDLFNCPKCRRTNFTAAGLKRHTCKPQA